MITNSIVTLPTSSVVAGFSRHGVPPPICNFDLWPFDLETGVRVASKVGNLPSKFGHARPLSSRIIRYVRAGRTDRDRRTDGQKQRLLPPSLWSGACIIKRNENQSIKTEIQLIEKYRMEHNKIVPVTVTRMHFCSIIVLCRYNTIQIYF